MPETRICFSCCMHHTASLPAAQPWGAGPAWWHQPAMQVHARSRVGSTWRVCMSAPTHRSMTARQHCRHSLLQAPWFKCTLYAPRVELPPCLMALWPLRCPWLLLPLQLPCLPLQGLIAEGAHWGHVWGGYGERCEYVQESNGGLRRGGDVPQSDPHMHLFKRTTPCMHLAWQIIKKLTRLASHILAQTLCRMGTARPCQPARFSPGCVQCESPPCMAGCAGKAWLSNAMRRNRTPLTLLTLKMFLARMFSTHAVGSKGRQRAPVRCIQLKVVWTDQARCSPPAQTLCVHGRNPTLAGTSSLQGVKSGGACRTMMGAAMQRPSHDKHQHNQPRCSEACTSTCTFLGCSLHLQMWHSSSPGCEGRRRAKGRGCRVLSSGVQSHPMRCHKHNTWGV